MLLRQGHSFGVDWWSLGIFICEIVTGFHPFQGHSHHVFTPTIINEVSSKRCKISCVIESLLVSEMSLLCFMILWKSYWTAIPIRIRKSHSISSLVDWAVDQKEYIFIHNPWYLISFILLLVKSIIIRSLQTSIGKPSTTKRSALASFQDSLQIQIWPSLILPSLMYSSL